MKSATFIGSSEPASIRRKIQLCLRCQRRFKDIQTRRISSSASRKGIMPQMNQGINYASQIPKQRSMNAQMKEMGASRIPTDFGFLPFTMVRPPGKSLPSWMGFQVRDRLRVEWFRLQQSVGSLFQLIYFLKYNNRKDPMTGHKIKSPPLELRLRPKIARDLHRQLYTAIAEGDTTTLRKIACDGLFQKQSIRIDQRQRSGFPAEHWKVEKYYGFTYPSWLRWPLISILPNSSTQVMVDKIAPLPVKKDSYIRQVVVRLRTRQRLDKGDGNGVKIADVTEYLVIQKSRIGESQKDWMVWGTVEPNTLAEIDDIISSTKMDGNVGIIERFKSMAPGFMN